jgi:hypothetical protein
MQNVTLIASDTGQIVKTASVSKIPAMRETVRFDDAPDKLYVVSAVHWDLSGEAESVLLYLSDIRQ